MQPVSFNETSRHQLTHIIIISAEICLNTLPLLGKRTNKQYRSELLGRRRIETEGNDEWEEEMERGGIDSMGDIPVVGQKGNE